mgnify:CR=1 FL=1
MGFGTDGAIVTLTPSGHERRSDVPVGLFRLTELAPRDGVFPVYPAPRVGRTLNTTDAFAADLVTFDAEGRVLTRWIAETGAQRDRVPAGDGLLHTVHLAGGTAAPMGFTERTRRTGWTCTHPMP